MEVIFNNPIALVFILILPLMIIFHYYFFEHNKRKAMKFSNFSAMKRVTGTKLITKNNSQLMLRIIIVLCVVLAASSPLIWYNGAVNDSDYILAIDTSASMTSEDVLPNRIGLAKQSAINFIDRLEGDTKIGLISFSGVSFIRKTLTNNREEIKQSISSIDIELSGGTDINSALISATNLLIPSKKNKVIILITDGSDTAGTFVYEGIDIAISYAKNNQVRVNTIGIGTGLSSPGYIEGTDLLAEYSRDTLRGIAEETGGKFYEVKSSAEMGTALKDISNQTLPGKIALELTPILLIIASILMLIEWGLLNTRFRALP